MTLIYDDFDDVYIWVETDNHDIPLSPEFDDEASARQWYGRVAAIMFNEFAVTSNQAMTNYKLKNAFIVVIAMIYILLAVGLIVVK